MHLNLEVRKVVVIIAYDVDIELTRHIGLTPTPREFSHQRGDVVAVAIDEYFLARWHVVVVLAPRLFLFGEAAYKRVLISFEVDAVVFSCRHLRTSYSG